MMAPHVATQPVEVAVRVRGLSPRERLNGCVSCIDVNADTGIITVGGERAFQFEHAFGPPSSQADVYRHAVAPLLEASFSGTNVSVLAYGAALLPSCNVSVHLLANALDCRH